MVNHINTYKSWNTFKCTSDITKSMIVDLCIALNSNEYYTGKYTFEIEPISEGGIIFRPTDETEVRFYKSIRFNAKNDQTRCIFPWVDADAMITWYYNPDVVFPRGCRIDTFLKAFYDAPEFTTIELNIIRELFASVIGAVKTR